ncbi:MAG: hypothetical protein EOS57_13385 [Mesorhizobium sp.]|uniref:hypothetical protein n=1 Tax=Mesorhizobium sp. TaxID=1871066 RepID=UPI000FE6B1BA|nr:hypothetical protein [Mesorhizobium sp.]RWB34321.1 MAG: hypothetical protein EOQ43_01325 [Mesorhizobium sp.]RWD19251.1 MAG: hypothetical protein EOS57_13385 [Mesorhizobium sp.]
MIEGGLDVAAKPVADLTLQQGKPEAVGSGFWTGGPSFSCQASVKTSPSPDHFSKTLPRRFDSAPYLAASRSRKKSVTLISRSRKSSITSRGSFFSRSTYTVIYARFG